MIYLKQSTAVTIPIGPFVDATDGFTLETALSLVQADFRLSKNGGTFAQKNDATSPAAHMENGWYALVLDATDTNTIGTLTIGVVDTNARQVWRECHVLAANVYDSLFGAATDKLDVNVEEWNTTAVPAEHTAGYPIVTIKDGTGTGEIDTTSGGVKVATFAAGAIDAAAIADNAIDAGAIAADAITAAKIATGAIDADSIAADAITAAKIADGAIDANTFAAGAITASAIAADAIGSSELAATAATEIAAAVWDKTRTDHVTAGTFGQALAGAINGSITSDPTTTTFTDTSLTQSETGHFNGRTLLFISGTLAGVATVITGFNPSTDTLTFEQVPTAPSVSDKFLII